MPGRLFSSGSYRYGFNGKEKDDKDGVVQYDYGFRIYDPRLVRFKSIDPLFKAYPYYTPYQFAGNNPIIAIDLDGLEEKIAITIGVNSNPKVDNMLYAKAIQIAAYSVHKQVKANELTSKGKENELQDALQGIANFALDDAWFAGNNSYTKEQFTELATSLYGYMFEAAKWWTSDFEDLYNGTITTTNDAYGGEDAYGVNDYSYNTVVFDKIEELNDAALSVVTSGGEAASFIAGASVGTGGTGNGPKGSKFANSPRSKPIIPNTATTETAGGQKALDVLEYAANNNGASRSGYRGGGTFANDGRGGGQVLPRTDGSGNNITYKEYDVNPYQRGVNRGTERVVIGSDGNGYYTSDHYGTFTPIRN